MIKILFWILGIILFVSCSGTQESGVISIDFRRLDKNGHFFSDKVFGGVSYVQLESDTACIVSSYANITIDDGKYYLFDPKMRQVCIFNSDGSFINKVGRIGRGPGEYASALDFQLDRITKEIEILSYYYDRKIYRYSEAGDFLGTRDNINAYAFVKKENGNYWLAKGIGADSLIGNEQIYELDPQNQIVRKYLPVPHTLHVGLPEKGFTASFDNSILYCTQFDNKVYRITSDTIRAIFEFDFGTLAYPKDLFVRPSAEVLQVLSEEHLSLGGNCLENRDYVYLNVALLGIGKNFEYYHILYHKKRKEVLCQKMERNSWEWELLMDPKALTENNELIFCANPESYNEALKRKNTLFYQSGEPIENVGDANNLLVKLLIKW